jgi:putative transposase
VRRHRLFVTDEDYQHFQRLMGAAQMKVPVRLIAYCLMPNHWHLVVWVSAVCAVSAHVRWLAWSHSCYFNKHHHFKGHAYEGRFNSRVVKEDRHLLTLLRYVEANPVAAGLVERAEQWQWSSLHRCREIVIAESPVRRPAYWLDLLSE